jgi:hypothetical protein
LNARTGRDCFGSGLAPVNFWLRHEHSFISDKIIGKGLTSVLAYVIPSCGTVIASLEIRIPSQWSAKPEFDILIMAPSRLPGQNQLRKGHPNRRCGKDCELRRL